MFSFLIESGDLQAFGITVLLWGGNPNKKTNKNKTNMLGKIYKTLAHEADLKLGETCSNLTMKYLQKQA